MAQNNNQASPKEDGNTIPGTIRRTVAIIRANVRLRERIEAFGNQRREQTENDNAMENNAMENNAMENNAMENNAMENNAMENDNAMENETDPESVVDGIVEQLSRFYTEIRPDLFENQGPVTTDGMNGKQLMVAVDLYRWKSSKKVTSAQWMKLIKDHIMHIMRNSSETSSLNDIVAKFLENLSFEDRQILQRVNVFNFPENQEVSNVSRHTLTQPLSIEVPEYQVNGAPVRPWERGIPGMAVAQRVVEEARARRQSRARARADGLLQIANRQRTNTPAQSTTRVPRSTNESDPAKPIQARGWDWERNPMSDERGFYQTDPNMMKGWFNQSYPDLNRLSHFNDYYERIRYFPIGEWHDNSIPSASRRGVWAKKHSIVRHHFFRAGSKEYYTNSEPSYRMMEPRPKVTVPTPILVYVSAEFGQRKTAAARSMAPPPPGRMRKRQEIICVHFNCGNEKKTYFIEPLHAIDKAMSKLHGITFDGNFFYKNGVKVETDMRNPRDIVRVIGGIAAFCTMLKEWFDQLKANSPESKPYLVFLSEKDIRNFYRSVYHLMVPMVEAAMVVDGIILSDDEPAKREENIRAWFTQAFPAVSTEKKFQTHLINHLEMKTDESGHIIPPSLPDVFYSFRVSAQNLDRITGKCHDPPKDVEYLRKAIMCCLSVPSPMGVKYNTEEEFLRIRFDESYNDGVSQRPLQDNLISEALIDADNEDSDVEIVEERAPRQPQADDSSSRDEDWPPLGTNQGTRKRRSYGVREKL